MSDTPRSPENKLVRRRTVAAGALWAAPVVAVSAAAPAFAGSCEPGPDQDEASDSGPGTYTVNFAAPAAPCTSYVVNFTLLGGQGGGSGSRGGRGRQLTGTLEISAATTVIIKVGSGGRYRGQNANPAKRGFGLGGTGGILGGGSLLDGGEGGSGSGMFVSSVYMANPVAIAGGGGGGRNGYISNGAGDLVWAFHVGTGGDAGDVNAENGYAGVMYRTDMPTNRRPANGGGGQGAVGGAPDAGNTNPAIVGTLTSATGTTDGGAGGNASDTGGNGGAGASDNTAVGVGAGGGGGGWAGGAGGSSFYEGGTTAPAYSRGVGGGGGGGSSYIASTSEVGGVPVSVPGSSLPGVKPPLGGANGPFSLSWNGPAATVNYDNS